MTRQSRQTYFLIPFLLYFRLLIPLVQCEISGSSSAWESRANLENSFGESPTDKDSVRSLTNPMKGDAGSLWSSLNAPQKDLIDFSGSGYPIMQGSFPDSYGRIESQGGKLRLQQIGISPYDSYEDIAQQSQLQENGLVEAQNLNQAPLYNSHRLNAMAVARVRPEGYRKYLINNLKRARDGYMCHFKLCQVGVSGKRLSM